MKPCWPLLCAFLVLFPWTQSLAAQMVRVGVYENSPKIFTGPDGVVQGIFIDILEEVATAEGWEIRYVPGTWSECLRRVEAGEIDLMPDVSFSEQRKARFAFSSVPVLTSWLQVYKKISSPIQLIQDLDGRTVALLEGSVQHESFNEIAAQFGITFTPLVLPDYQATVRAVMEGDADVLIASRFYAFSSTRPRQLVDTNIVFRPTMAFFVTGKDADPNLLAAIDQHMVEMKNHPDSAYYRSLAFWLRDPPLTAIPWYVWWLLLVLVGGGLALFFFNHLLQLQVKRNRAELARNQERFIQLQEQLAQAQKMEAIGTLAGGIAHDFNNILTAILGYGEMVLDSLPAGSRARADQQEVLRAGNRAKELVRQILTFSRQGKQELSPIEIHPIIKEAVKLLRSSIPTSIEIKADIAVDCGVVLADPTQIHQVLMNLATNAFHAMQEQGGVLGISLYQKELDPDHCQLLGINPGRYVCLEVSDTGTGMDQETMARAFDSYFTTKEQGVGTGLGLSIIRGIVESLHGRVTLQSTVGKGSVFEVCLPAVDRKEISGEMGLDEPIPSGNEHILLVDDEEALVDLGRSMLKRLGYRVTAVTSSVEALALFQQQPHAFDLLITDQAMPEMTGAELSRKILALAPGFPIILCTGFSSAIFEEKALALGIREFVLKPFTRRSIGTVIRRALGDKSG